MIPIANYGRVACGIMVGFVFNLITTLAPNNNLTIALILGAPVIPAIVLIFALWRCPESPRYYLRREKPNYIRALEELRTLRSNCEVSLLMSGLLIKLMFSVPSFSLTETCISFTSLYMKNASTRPLHNQSNVNSNTESCSQMISLD